MTRSLRGELRVTAAVTALLLALVGLTGMVAVVVVDRGFEQVTEEVVPSLAATNDLLDGLTEMDSALRGFVISADIRFLVPYESAFAELPEQRATARAAISDDPTAVRLLDEHEAAIDAWLTQYAVPRRSEPVGPEAVDPVRLREGALLFDEIRATGGRLQSHLRGRLADLRERTSSVETTTIGAVLLITTVGVLAGALASRVVSRRVREPLERLRRVLGQLTAGRHEARAVPAGPVEVVQIAHSVNALAEESDRLRGAEMEKQRMQEQLLDLGNRVRSELDEKEIAKIGVTVLGETLRLRRAYLRLLRGGRPSEVLAQWHARGVRPLPDTIQHLSPTDPEGIADMLAGGAPHVAPDVRADPRYSADTARPWVELVGAGAVLTVPVVVDDESVALLSLIDSSPRDWGGQAIAFADSAAAVLARAVGQNRLHARQVDAMERLRALDRAKDDFVSGVSHELRTPLTSISGYVELLREGDLGDVEPTQAHALDVVQRNVVRLRALIEDLLTLSRIEAGDFRLRLADVDLVRVVSTVVEDMAPQADEREVEVTLTVPGQPVVLCGDEAQLTRAVLNLTSNAIKFTPAGGRVDLRVDVDDERGGVAVGVRDTGIGIPAGEVGQLFDRFFRASNAARSGIPGTGLGLAIVHTIVEQHGGHLGLDSTEGEGTTVTMHLPLPDPTDATPRRAGA